MHHFYGKDDKRVTYYEFFRSANTARTQCDCDFERRMQSNWKLYSNHKDL